MDTIIYKVPQQNCETVIFIHSSYHLYCKELKISSTFCIFLLKPISCQFVSSFFSSREKSKTLCLD